YHFSIFFFFNHPPTTEFYTLSLHDALPISFRLDPRVTIDGSEVTAEVAQLGLLGFGETLEDAMEDLVEELRAYARDFFKRASFYAETDRAGHAPWLLRFALAPLDRQLELLYEDSRVAAAS